MVYAANVIDGVVDDVFELTPMHEVYSEESEPEWVEVRSFDFGSVTVGMLIEDGHYYFPFIWAGGAA